MNYILVTRPQPDADATAALLRMQGFAPLVDPLFIAEFTEASPGKQNYQAVLATSRNAIRALARCGVMADFKDIPLFAVGDETEAEARLAGFTKVEHAAHSALSLSRLVKERAVPMRGPLLYLTGRTRTAIIEAELAAGGFKLQPWEGYAMQPSKVFGPDTLDALKREAIAAILLFSGRASAHFLELGNVLEEKILRVPQYICLSEQTALPLRQKGFEALVPSSPGVQAMIALLNHKKC